MKLVGATRAFIGRPFIVRGVLQGLYSAFIAIILLSAILYFLMKQVPELINLYDLYIYLAVFGLVIITGMFLSWISTFFAVRKYLKMNEDDLYY
jgi:cell division transport system permease protein